MSAKLISEERESLLLKIPPTVNIEVVEDSEESEDESNLPEESNALSR